MRSLLAAAGVCTALALACAEPDGRARVEIRDAVVHAEVADTPEKKQRGLSGRPGLAQGEGMLFRYRIADRYGFWMKDMHFDIDIIWIRGEHIVDMTERAPHRVAPPLPTYRPRTPADTILEVPAGFAEQARWRIGDRVRIDY